MLHHRRLFSAGCAALFASACLALYGHDARACGGCFHPPPQPQEVDGTVVTDHRMAFSMSPAQTVLWDQIRYSGNPKDFAWVLPVKPGARIELSHDEWIAALDASTQTVITGPTPPSCGGSAPTEDTGSGGGCAFGGMKSAASEGFADNAAAFVDAGEGQVQVISQQVVGPYDAVTVRSSQGEALGEWLRANGYDLPLSMQPTVDAFSSAGFDFIALKLAPAAGVQAMQPVRVVTPGADPALPLRMVAAGVGAHVGLELYVLSEGRYHPQNFPDAVIDFTRLAWDPTLGRSNYTELAQAALAANSGTGWLTESSQIANLYGFSGANPGLALTYQTTCRPQVFIPPCSSASAGTATAPSAVSGDAAPEAEAGGEGGGPGEAAAPTDAPSASEADSSATDDGGEGGMPPSLGSASASGTCAPPTVQPCDDLSLAMTGIAGGDLWVTRLRADFPASALAYDLVLEATTSQTPVTNQHHTDAYTIPNYNPCSTTSSAATPSARPSSGSSSGCACRTAESPQGRYADAILLALGAVGLALSVRRRARR